MYVLEINVKHTMAIGKSVADMTSAEKAAGVILWSEIETTAMDAALNALNPDVWDHHYVGTECPISWRVDTWEFVSSGHWVISPGEAHVTPHRVITMVELRRKGTNYTVKFVNSHFVSGAFKDKFPGTHDIRLKYWNMDDAAMIEHVHSWITQGDTVVGGGDYNRSHVEKFAPEVQWLSPTSGYDYLWYIEGSKGPTVEVLATDTIGQAWNTDHPARRAHLNFHPRTVAPTPVPVPPVAPQPPAEPSPALALVDALAADVEALRTALTAS